MNHISPFESYLTKFWGLLRVARINTALIIGLTVFIPWFVYTSSIGQSFAKSLPFILAAMGAFTQNDANDVVKDSISKPHRPIPSGIVTVSSAKLTSKIYYVLFCISCVWAVDSLSVLLIYVFVFGGCVFYDYLLKKIPVLKNLVTALVSTMPFFIFVITFKDVSYISLIIASIAYIFARELLMDIRDISADSLCNMKTIPYIIGVKSATHIAYSLFVITFLLIVSTVLLRFSLVRLLIMIVIGIVLLVSILLWAKGNQYQKRVAIMLLWLPMLLTLSIAI